MTNIGTEEVRSYWLLEQQRRTGWTAGPGSLIESLPPYDLTAVSPIDQA